MEKGKQVGRHPSLVGERAPSKTWEEKTHRTSKPWALRDRGLLNWKKKKKGRKKKGGAATADRIDNNLHGTGLRGKSGRAEKETTSLVRARDRPSGRLQKKKTAYSALTTVRTKRRQRNNSENNPHRGKYVFQYFRALKKSKSGKDDETKNVSDFLDSQEKRKKREQTSYRWVDRENKDKKLCLTYDEGT